jgi:hypothetical protein
LDVCQAAAETEKGGSTLIKKLAAIVVLGTGMTVAAVAADTDAGEWGYRHHHHHKVPEISLAPGMSSLLVMAGMIVMLRNRRKRPNEAL